MRQGIIGSGKKLGPSSRCKPIGKREMESRNDEIESTLSIDNIPYKGNVNLLAQR